MFKVNNKNAKCEIYSKLTMKTLERRLGFIGVFIINFEYISYLSLVFLLLILSS